MVLRPDSGDPVEAVLMVGVIPGVYLWQPTLLDPGLPCILHESACKWS
jgi:hypothetical protein